MRAVGILRPSCVCHPRTYFKGLFGTTMLVFPRVRRTPCVFFPSTRVCVYLISLNTIKSPPPSHRRRFFRINAVSYLDCFPFVSHATIILACLNNPRPAKFRVRSARRDRRSVSGRLHDGRAKAAHDGHNRPLRGRALPRSVLRKHRLSGGRRRCGLEYRHPNGCGAFLVGVSAAFFLMRARNILSEFYQSTIKHVISGHRRLSKAKKKRAVQALRNLPHRGTSKVCVRTMYSRAGVDDLSTEKPSARRCTTICGIPSYIYIFFLFFFFFHFSSAEHWRAVTYKTAML